MTVTSRKRCRNPECTNWIPFDDRRTYCSAKCRRRANYLKERRRERVRVEKPWIVKVCPYCGVSFHTRNARQVTCTKAHQVAYWKWRKRRKVARERDAANNVLLQLEMLAAGADLPFVTFGDLTA